MTRWLTVNRDRIPLLIFTIGSTGLAVIVVMNIILYCRILSVDFEMFRRKAVKEGKGEKQLRRSTAYVDSLIQEDSGKLSVD
jgi:hypothetical protein